MSQPHGVRVRLAYDARRNEILKAAADLFAARNVDDVSTTELATAAGVSRGLLNHYFATKRDLYLAVIERFVDFPQLPSAPYFEGITADERIRTSVVAWLDLVEHRSASWLTAVNIGASGRDVEAQALIEAATDRVVDQILDVAGLARVAEGREDVRTALRGYAALATSVTRDWLQFARLNRNQVEILLTETLLAIVGSVLPALVS